jgi:ABC-type sugar transport system ATPase subunit
MTDGEFLLEADRLVKRFGGVTALAGAGIRLRGGEVHALVGENGAGKSTLVNIVTGAVRPDSGTIRLDGRHVSFGSAREAARGGIAVVAQELALFPDLSVGENLFPYAPPLRYGLLSRREMGRRARPVLDSLGLDGLPMLRQVGELALADQQLVEVARALLLDPRVLILDEPTSALPPAAVDRLESVLRTLVRRGIAVLYISHVLAEVRRFSQRISVLREGAVVLDGVPVGSVQVPDLIRAMLGEEQAARPAAGGGAAGTDGTDAGVPGPPVAELREVTAAGRTGLLTAVSLTAPARVVTGLAGLQDAGHLTALQVVCGRVRPAAGAVAVCGRGRPRSLRAAVRAGVAFVPSDRKRYGLMLDRAVWENTSAVRWLALGAGGVLLRPRALRRRAGRLLERLRVRGDPATEAWRLSGGNQQKLVFAKWLDADPRLLVLDDPTRGVDVRARSEMHALIREFAAGGAAEAGTVDRRTRAVLMAGTDLAELAECCDRVLVFRSGRIVAELAGERLTEHQLSLTMNLGTEAGAGSG